MFILRYTEWTKFVPAKYNFLHKSALLDKFATELFYKSNGVMNKINTDEICTLCN